MRRLSLVYALAISSLGAVQAGAQNRKITFEHGNFSEIKAKAKKENKLIFVDAFTTWCSPCKQMAKNVFTNDTVADYFNANLVNAKIDMEKGEGLEIAKQYEVQCYPNLLFIDGDGKLLHRIAGYMSPSDFIAEATKAKEPEKRFSYYANNYESNKQNADFLAKYVAAMSSTCLDPGAAISQYFSLQKEEELTSKQNWEMIKEHVNNMSDKEFVYLVANKRKFEELYTAKEVNAKMDNVNRNTLLTIIRAKPFDEKAYNDTKAKITAMNLTNTKRVFFEADLRLAQKSNDWGTYAKLAVENVDTYYGNDPNLLNSIAWEFYEKVSDKPALLKAESWAAKAVEIDPSYPNMDTYASVLYKNGKHDQALQMANKAIEVAKKDGYSKDDYKGTKDLIEKIKAPK